MEIAFLGDSLTEGWPGSAFFPLLESLVPEHRLHNHGRAGDTTADLLARMRRRPPAGELAFSVLSLVLAWRGYGALSIVIAGGARALVRAVLALWVTDRREWLTPHALEGGIFREILRYGAPIMAARLSSVIARRGDNLAFTRLFGLARTGAYNLAYNLADVPATTVGELRAEEARRQTDHVAVRVLGRVRNGSPQDHADEVVHRQQAEPPRHAAFARAQAPERRRRQGGPPRDPGHDRQGPTPGRRRGGSVKLHHLRPGPGGTAKKKRVGRGRAAGQDQQRQRRTEPRN